MTGAIAISIAYGIDVSWKDDPLIEIAENAMAPLAGTSSPWPVDFMPWLQYVPSWFPGAGFQLKATEWREWMVKSLTVPFERGLEGIVSLGISANQVTI